MLFLVYYSFFRNNSLHFTLNESMPKFSQLRLILLFSIANRFARALLPIFNLLVLSRVFMALKGSLLLRGILDFVEDCGLDVKTH